MTTEDFPGAFVRKRINRGLSQKAAAAVLGVTQGTISKWESGVDTPQPANHPALADFMNVSQKKLVEMLEAPPARITEVAKELHRLIDELVRAFQEGQG